MQHDMMRASGQITTSDNVGDVLASIRRLIAQDEGGKQLPGRPLGENPFAPKARPTADAAAEPFVLGHDDLIVPQAPEVAQDAPRLHLASISAAAVQAGPALAAPSGWQPALIADWPHAEVTQTPMRLADALSHISVSFAAPADVSTDEPGLTPEEEAEIAEAEAILAKMIQAVHVPVAEPTIVDEMPEAQLTEAEIPLDKADEQAQNLFVDAADDQQAAFREMIRSVIRDELQGEMGDRLSRNLRQTIRREVEVVIRELCAET